jgi:hypothetical protein
MVLPEESGACYDQAGGWAARSRLDFPLAAKPGIGKRFLMVFEQPTSAAATAFTNACFA